MSRPTGLSRFEFSVVLILFGILAHTLLDRLVTLEHETERLEVDLTVRHINTGIKLAMGERLMHGEAHRVQDILQENPLDFLGRKVGAGRAEESRWTYDRPSRTLRYMPRQPEAFAGQEMLAWRLTGHTDELGRMAGLRLVPVDK